MLEQLNQLIEKDYIKLISENFVYQQLILVVGAILLAFLFKKLASRLEKRISAHITISWIRAMLHIFAEASKPFFAFVLIRLVEQILPLFDFPIHVLDWFSDIILIWFVFRLVQKALEHNFHEERALFWSRKVLTPLIFITLLLSSFGVLGDVLNWKLKFENLEFNISLWSLIVGLSILFIFGQIGRWFRVALNRSILPQVGADRAVSHAISTLSFYFIIFLGVIMSLSAIGVNLSSLTVVAGGLSVGIGFGMQAIVSNFVSGFILLFEKSVGPGDVIEIGGKTGEVKTIGIRSITLLTKDNIELIIPNSHYLTDIVTNLTRSSNEVRLRVSVGTSYDSNPSEVKEALIAVCDHPKLIKKPEPRVHFSEFGDSSLNFELLVWTREAEKIPLISSDLRFRIFEEFKKRNIEIPFPQRDIHIRSDIRAD